MRVHVRRAAGFLVVLIFIPTIGSPQQALTLRQAVQQALKQSPEGDEIRAAADEAKAGVAIARTQLLPQIGFLEDISRGNDPVYVFGTKLRQQRFTQADFSLDALNRPTSIGNFASRFSGQWMAFDFFRTQKNVASADRMKQSTEWQAKAVDQRIVFEVVKAYQDVLYAERQVEVAQHELETAEALLNSVEDRVKAGLAVESDRMSAQVNEAAVKEGMIAAQGGLNLAWAQLRVATGSPTLAQSPLAPIEAKDFPDIPLEQSLQAAAKTRPDLAAVRKAQDAQVATASAARLGYAPRVSAYGQWEDDRAAGGPGGSSWVAGVQIGIDLLPFSKRAQVAQARAGVARAAAQAKSYEQQVRLQVTQAHIQRQTARLSLDAAKAAVDQARESLRILRNRYGAGLATMTDLLRGEDAERQAQENYWRAVYGNSVAYAQLLFATGALTPDAAEGLQ